ncbi:sulfurtransferase TusA family protein [Conexibacter sp. DBS9H8]|uniref:sulfurtransferase TusA family protein n=1 Tax=Conexibacter sp. DBS9H8 TaxID=2937801 RepID=UPI00200F6FA0|nr:sulfurtransferase TusA family protein [Conexibacter sp. DBS9H8]
MSEIAPGQTLDVTGKACPIPVVKTAKAMKEMSSGDVLEVLATDPGVDPDMHAWSKQTGNELISIEQNAGVFRVLLRKS